MHFTFTPEEAAFQKDLRDFLKAEIPPGYKGADEYGRSEDVEFERYMRQRLIERGWLTMAWPREYGGQDASNVKMAIFAEEMMYHEAPGKDSSGVGLLAPAVMRHGTHEQKAKYLPPISKGRGHLGPGIQRAGVRLRSRFPPDPGRPWMATTTSSPAKKSGPAAPTSPTGCSSSPAPTPTPQSIAASPTSWST